MNWGICNSEGPQDKNWQIQCEYLIVQSILTIFVQEKLLTSVSFESNRTARIERQNSIGAGRQKYFPVRFLISIIFLAIGCGVWVKRYVFVSVSR